MPKTNVFFPAPLCALFLTRRGSKLSSNSTVPRKRRSSSHASVMRSCKQARKGVRAVAVEAAVTNKELRDLDRREIGGYVTQEPTKTVSESRERTTKRFFAVNKLSRSIRRGSYSHDHLFLLLQQSKTHKCRSSASHVRDLCILVRTLYQFGHFQRVSSGFSLDVHRRVPSTEKNSTHQLHIQNRDAH